jgi:hypothetical protein
VLVELPGFLSASSTAFFVISLKRTRCTFFALGPELLRDVPGDRLALAIGVGREVDVLLVLGRLLDLVEDLRLALDDVVLGREVVLDVDPELRLGQVHHVPDRRLHEVVLAEVLAERLGLGR